MIPAWQHKLENVEFLTKGDRDLMIAWLLNHPDAGEMPEEIRKARLKKYGYVEPKPQSKVEPEVKQEDKPVRTRTRNPKIRSMSSQERQASKERAKKND